MTARKDGLLKFMQTCTVYPEPTGAEDAECGGGLIRPVLKKTKRFDRKERLIVLLVNRKTKGREA